MGHYKEIGIGCINDKKAFFLFFPQPSISHAERSSPGERRDERLSARISDAVTPFELLEAGTAASACQLRGRARQLEHPVTNAHARALATECTFSNAS